MPAQIRTKIRKIGVLTGGGDVPGLNAAIKAVVYRAGHLDIEVLGLRAGWEGNHIPRPLKRSRRFDFRACGPEHLGWRISPSAR